MTRRLSYIAVEGQHDAAFIGRLLKNAGFRIVVNKHDLDPAYIRLVPTDFPYEDDLLKRVPVPFFYQKTDHAVALHPAGGESELAGRAVIAVPQVSGVVEAIGFVLDADNKGTPVERLVKLGTQIAGRSTTPGFTLPTTLREVHPGPPRCGVFVMPDNAANGTLEDMLLDCAAAHYGDLMTKADSYIQAIDRAKLSTSDLVEISTPAGPKKAQIGTISAVLKPGKAIQNSIADNRWLEGRAAEQPKVVAFRGFLRNLLNEPGIYPGSSASPTAASSP